MLEVLPSPGVSAASEVFRSKVLKAGRSRAGVFFGDEDSTGTGFGRVRSASDGCCLDGSGNGDFGGEDGGVALSGSSLERVSAELDMPGSLMPRLVKAGPASASVSSLRYAAEPTPRSAV